MRVGLQFRQAVVQGPIARAPVDRSLVPVGQNTKSRQQFAHLIVLEHRWKAQYGGMRANDAKRLKDLEHENVRLKRIVADQALDIDNV